MNDQIPYHHLSEQEAMESLGSDHAGLTWTEVEERWHQFGQNIIESGKKVSKLKILLEQLLNPFVFILVAAAIISLLVDHAIDAIVIGAIILINTAIGYFQEYKAEEALEALSRRAAPEANVLRRNHQTGKSIEQTIPAADIVPGDIILLETGDKVPADARMISTINLEIDESMLTGESLPVGKSVEAVEEDAAIGDRVNLAFAGSVVTHGRGKAVVYATGLKTEVGKIASLIQQTVKEVTPLRRQADKLGKYLAVFALVISMIVFVIGIQNLNDSSMGDIFLFALASAISSIPEGLPAVMTITLAVGVNRMAQRNAIIRKLQAVDTLGAATVICTDKTGTLTTNQMTAQEIFTAEQQIKVSGVGFRPEGNLMDDHKAIKVEPDSPLYWTLAGGTLCNDASLIFNEEHGGHEWSIRGDPTEGALVVLAAKADLSKDDLEDAFPRQDEIPFDSKKKFMATFHKHEDGRQFVFLKGAPEEVLDMSTSILTAKGKSKLTGAWKKKIDQANAAMANHAMRVLAVAFCDDASDPKELKDNIHQGKSCLTFAGLVGMIDPPREEVKKSIAICRKAGIRVIMATGDHQITASAIGKQLGLLERGNRVLTGADMENMGDDALDQAVEKTTIFARVSPEHKFRLVEALKRKGHVVAMTGDGVNDAPALKSSQVGVAMGITGTDVAKETADMVLTDDNFASIVSAVEEGRVVFENIRKVVKFLIATNFGEDMAIIASMLLLPGLQLIFTPVQILWVNLVTDGVLDITIAMEPKERGVMDEPPRKIDTSIVNKEILLNTLYVAMIMAAGTVYMFMFGNGNGGIAYARTLAFVTLAMFQVFNAFNVRSRTQSIFHLGIFSNKYLIAAIGVSVSLLLGTVYLPFMHTIMSTVPLSAADWLKIVPLTSSIFILEELRKFIRNQLAKRTQNALELTS